MNYISAKEAAEKWRISQRRVAVLCAEDRIKGAMMVGNMWIIPSNAQKPEDKRKAKVEDGMKKYTVTIEEMISKDFEVQARDIEEALSLAEKNYNEGKFVVKPGNLVCKQISANDGQGDCVDWYEF